MLANEGRSYFFLFSDMLLFTEREVQKGRTTGQGRLPKDLSYYSFQIWDGSVVELAALRAVELTTCVLCNIVYIVQLPFDVVILDEMMLKMDSHALDASVSERRGITLKPLELEKSSMHGHREFPFRWYCASATEQQSW